MEKQDRPIAIITASGSLLTPSLWMSPRTTNASSDAFLVSPSKNGLNNRPWIIDRLHFHCTFRGENRRPRTSETNFVVEGAIPESAKDKVPDSVRYRSLTEGK